MKRRTTMIVALLVGVLLVCGPRLVLLLRGDVQLGGREGVRSWVGRWEENYALSASDETQRKHLVPGSVAERIVQGALRQAEKERGDDEPGLRHGGPGDQAGHPLLPQRRCLFPVGLLARRVRRPVSGFAWG